MDHQLTSIKREYHDFSAQITFTLKTERERFKEERRSWLDSFVAERSSSPNAPSSLVLHPLYLCRQSLARCECNSSLSLSLSFPFLPLPPLPFLTFHGCVCVCECVCM